MFKFGPWSDSLKREFFGGLLAALFGGLFAGFGLQYPLGTPAAMGPGFFPVALGALLGIVGLSISAAGLLGITTDDGGSFGSRPDWRGWGCILAGVISFVLMAERLGLLPATFFCVFISALGDRTATVKGSLLLAGCLAILGTILFVYVLQLPLPALRL